MCTMRSALIWKNSIASRVTKRSAYHQLSQREIASEVLLDWESFRQTVHLLDSSEAWERFVAAWMKLLFQLSAITAWFFKMRTSVYKLEERRRPLNDNLTNLERHLLERHRKLQFISVFFWGCCLKLFFSKDKQLVICTIHSGSLRNWVSIHM